VQELPSLDKEGQRWRNPSAGWLQQALGRTTPAMASGYSIPLLNRGVEYYINISTPCTYVAVYNQEEEKRDNQI